MCGALAAEVSLESNPENQTDMEKQSIGTMRSWCFLSKEMWYFCHSAVSHGAAGHSVLRLDQIFSLSHCLFLADFGAGLSWPRCLTAAVPVRECCLRSHKSMFICYLCVSVCVWHRIQRSNAFVYQRVHAVNVYNICFNWFLTVCVRQPDGQTCSQSNIQVKGYFSY